MTKAPCKFHLLQGACSSPVVCRAPLFLPCSLQGYRLRCLCPGRNAAWPQRAAASCLAQPRVGCGHDALQIRDLTGGVFETCPTKAERRLCEGLGPPEHHDAPIPSERVCKSACGASCCTASGTHTPSSLTSGDMNATPIFRLSPATSVLRVSSAQGPLRRFACIVTHRRAGKTVACIHCPSPTPWTTGPPTRPTRSDTWR